MKDMCYRIGTLACKASDLESTVDAINLLRSHGVGIVCRKASLEGEDIVVRVAISGTSSMQLDMASSALGDALDTCRISWSPLVPRASNPRSISAARAIDDADTKSPLAVESLLPPDAAADPFAGLVGMEEQIAFAKRVAAAVGTFGRNAFESLSLVLTGAPGVGKTEFARRLATYYGQAGVTSGGFSLVGAKDLVAYHVGETAHLVASAFNDARGGILFVDEAYALIDGAGNDFGVEAVNALVDNMDRMRGEVVVVAAGYPDKMEAFLDSNPGLRSRFGFSMAMRAYTPSEMVGIFHGFADRKRIDMRVDDGDLWRVFDKLEGVRGYAAARTARNLFDRALLSAAANHPGEAVILADDVTSEAEALLAGRAARGVLGFA